MTKSSVEFVVASSFLDVFTTASNSNVFTVGSNIAASNVFTGTAFEPSDETDFYNRFADDFNTPPQETVVGEIEGIGKQNISRRVLGNMAIFRNNFNRRSFKKDCYGFAASVMEGDPGLKYWVSGENFIEDPNTSKYWECRKEFLDIKDTASIGDIVILTERNKTSHAAVKATDGKIPMYISKIGLYDVYMHSLYDAAQNYDCDGLFIPTSVNFP